jgi:hypothetical protein
MVAAVLSLRLALVWYVLHDVVLLIMEVLLGMLVYCAALWLVGRGLARDVLRLLSATGKAELGLSLPAFEKSGAAND